MSVLQAWLLAGIPMLVLGMMFFVASAQWANLAGFVVLAIGFVILTSVDRASGATFGALLALLYATGRGRGAAASNSQEAIPDVARDDGHGHVGT